MKRIKVGGMSCPHCVKSVTEALSALEGIENVKVDLASGEATFDAADTVSPETVRDAIVKIGFEAGETG